MRITKSQKIKKLTFDDAIKEFHELTDIVKRETTKKGEIASLQQIFKFFKSFPESNEVKKYSPKACIKNHYSLTYLHDVTEDHVFELKQYLLKLAKMRTDAEPVINAQIAKSVNEQERWELHLKLKKTGMSPATARSYFRDFRTLFNRLEANKKISYNPVKNVDAISIPKSRKARSKSYSLEDISKILNAEYEHSEGFPMKEFFELLLEGPRYMAVLCAEWSDFDFERKIWKIRSKPLCPTPNGLGFYPKTEDREIPLSNRAIEILKSIPRRKSVGYIKGDPSDTPYPADFVFTVKDLRKRKSPNYGGWCRPNSVKTAWKTLLKRAGIPFRGLDKLHFHDTRRFRNEYDKHINNLSIEDRSKKLGHSPKINQEHYSAKFDETVTNQANEIKSLQRQVLLLKERVKIEKVQKKGAA